MIKPMRLMQRHHAQDAMEPHFSAVWERMTNWKSFMMEAKEFKDSRTVRERFENSTQIPATF